MEQLMADEFDKYLSQVLVIELFQSQHFKIINNV